MSRILTSISALTFFLFSTQVWADDCEKVDEDGKVIDCSVVATGNVDRIEIQHSFIGGHDDTFALMLVYRNGKREECDGTTEKFGKDAEGSAVLDCTFALQDSQGTFERIRVISVWMNTDRERIQLKAK